VTRSADLLRDGRGLLLDLVDRAEVRDAAAAWTGRVNTVTARTDRVDQLPGLGRLRILLVLGRHASVESELMMASYSSVLAG
jgi:hypothetical protein